MKFIVVAIILVTVFLLLLSCGCAKRQNVFQDPHFFYDEEHYTLIRVNPETREEDIKKYKERKEVTMFKSFKVSPEADTSKIQDIPPRVKKVVVPKYPKYVLERGYSGKVYLQLLVDEKGIVTLAGPSSSIQHREDIAIHLIRAAVEAAIQTEFFPALHNGEPVKVWVTYPMQFKIIKGAPEVRFPANLVP